MSTNSDTLLTDDSNPWWGTVRWFRTLLANAFGFGSPREGMEASGILFIITFASNAIGFWFTLVFDALFFLLFMFNAARWLWAYWRGS